MAEDRGVGFSKEPAAPKPTGTKYFFGIGIDRYKYWKPLRNAGNDVTEVLDLLLRQYDFEPQHTLLLKDSDATRSRIVNQLHTYTMTGTLSENDSLLIYFSGHGHLDENNDGYWVPAEAQKDDIDSLIPNTILRDKIRNMKCRHVLVVSDSCFSGSLIARSDDNQDADKLVATSLMQRSSRRIMTSGGHFEPVSDGSNRNSPFAEALISELTHNQKPFFMLDELFSSVRKITWNNTNQMPELEPLHGAGDLGGRFVFLQKNTSYELLTATPNPNDTKERGKNAGSSVRDDQKKKEDAHKKQEELMQMIAKGNSDMAIKAMIELADKEYPDLSASVVQLSGRWQNLRKQELLGILSFSEGSVERNKINNGLLEMIRMFE